MAIELEQALTREGFEIVGPFHSSSAALTHITADLAAATVSFHLSDGTCERLVLNLRALAIPCLLVTGIVSIPRELADLTVVQKPFDIERVVAAVHHAARP